MNSGPKYKGSVKEVVGVMDFGLVGLRMKGALAGEPFTVSRNWPSMGHSFLDQKSPDVKT